jgi:virulence factor Mce-like protein
VSTNQRRSQQSAFANPVLIGAMTVLVVMVAVFLAYNANAGLPFVPTRQLKVDIASGSDLAVGDEVREGGFLIGAISGMKPIQLDTGQVGAQLTLSLDQDYGKVPVDSTAQIVPRSLLGLKYVDLHNGTSSRVFADGSTMPITQTSVPVQFEDLFQAFDPKTRSAVDQNLVGFGDTLAGRGSALNDTIASLPALLVV